METGLEGKPIYFGGIAAVVLVGLCLLGGHFLLYENQNRDINKKTKQLEGLRKQINEGRAAERSLPQFREEVRRLELELEKLLRILPSRRRTDDLLRRVRSLTEQGDLEFMRFAPGDPSEVSDFYSEWPIDIALQGSYHNLALLFDRVSRFSRIINIDNLVVTPLRDNRGNSRHTISARFVAKTFLSNDTTPDEEEGP